MDDEASLRSKLESRALISALPQPTSTSIPNSFIPITDIDELLNYPSILAELLKLGYMDDKAQTCANQVWRVARKGFAILVCIDMAWGIQGLLDDGFTDAHLPLKTDDAENPAILVSKQQNHLFLSTSTWAVQVRVAFLRKQWLMLSPIFGQVGEHFDLDDGCVLPFTFGCAEGKDTGSSLIYIVRVHRSHWKFTVQASYPAFMGKNG
jgi:hypothetical protein